MKKVGYVLILLGVVNLFRRYEGYYGFAGYFDNAFELIGQSLFLVLIGIGLIRLDKL